MPYHIIRNINKYKDMNEAINQGVEKGKYIFEYLGDIITIYIENGFLKTGYGNYKYTIDEIMFLLTGK